MGGAIWLRTSVRTAGVAVAVAAVAVIAQAISFSASPRSILHTSTTSPVDLGGYTRLVDSNVDWGRTWCA